MGKGRSFTFTVFAVLGAITGYATYMARKDSFSDETKDKYDSFLNNAKNVGTDIQRTYTSIGDKKQFTNNTKNLSASAKNLASNVGNLFVSATNDIYRHMKSQVSDTIDNVKSDFKSSSSAQKSSIKEDAKNRKSHSRTSIKQKKKIKK